MYFTVKDKASLSMFLRSHGGLYLYQSVGDWYQRFRDKIALTLAVQAGKTSGGNGDDRELLLPPRAPGPESLIVSRSLLLAKKASALSQHPEGCFCFCQPGYVAKQQPPLPSHQQEKASVQGRQLPNPSTTAESVVHRAIRLHPPPPESLLGSSPIEHTEATPFKGLDPYGRGVQAPGSSSHQLQVQPLSLDPSWLLPFFHHGCPNQPAPSALPWGFSHVFFLPLIPCSMSPVIFLP